MRARGRSATAGFTLIEVLAALAILGLFGAVLMRGLVGLRFGSAAVTETLQAETVARSLLEGPIPRTLARPGRQEGKAGALPWTMVSETVDLPMPKRKEGEEPPAFVPIRLTVIVSMPRGRTLSAETIRLVRKPEGS